MSDTPQPAPPRPSLARRVRLPRVSGKVSAAWLVVCFALTAALIPMVLRQETWIKYEIVLAVWWSVWVGVLTWLLYTGHRVTDDHRMSEPRNWLPAWSSSKSESSDPGWPWWWWAPIEAEGCAYALMILVAAVVLFFAAWLIIEIAIPLVLFLLYFVTRGMLASVTNDRHRCEGRPAKAFGWAVLWATAYTVPLALAVWVVHLLHERSKVGG
jgi:hypothetical protein